MKYYLILLILSTLSFVPGAKGQWRLFDDSAFADGLFTSITRTPEGYIATYSNSLYYSSYIPAYFKWHKLPVKVVPEQILSIGNTLFGIYNESVSSYRLISSVDTFRTYSSGVYAGSMFKIGKRLFINKNYYVLHYSDDNGATFKTVSNVSTRFSYANKEYIFNDSVRLFLMQDSAGINNDILCYVSYDGVNIDHLLTLSSVNSINAPVSYQSGKLYVCNTDSRISEINLSDGNILADGLSPADETGEKCIDIWKSGEYYYACFTETDQSSIVYYKLYKSTDLRDWQLINSISGRHTFSYQYIGAGEDILSDSEKAYKLTADGIVQVLNTGIKVYTDVLQAGMDRIEAQNVYGSNWINTDHSVKPLEAHDFEKYSALQLYVKPLNYYLDGKDNKILISGNSISYDKGGSWHPLVLPQLAGTSPVLLGYNERNIIVYDSAGALFDSRDTGRTWKEISTGISYSRNNRHFVPFLLQYQNGYFLTGLNDSGTALRTFFTDTPGKTWKSAGNDFFDFKSLQGMNVYCTHDGRLYVVLSGSSDNGISSIYYLDKGAKEWKQSSLIGLPRDRSMAIVGWQDNIMAFVHGVGLYVSGDLGNTFVRDTSFPVESNYYTQSALLDTTVFISTSEGIYTNSNLVKYYSAIDGTLIQRPADGNSLSTPITVYPNPATDNVNISFSDTGGQQIYIQFIDATGQIVKEITATSIEGLNTITFDRKGLRKGLYVLRLVDGDRAQNCKVILTQR